MGDIYRAVRLGESCADRVYPLISLFNPAMSRCNWKALLADRSDPTAGGFFSVETKRGHSHAIFGYRVERDIRHGRALRVYGLITSGLPGSSLHDFIIRHAEDLARDAGCEGILFEIGSTASDGEACRASEPLVRKGFSKVASAFFRPVSQTA